MNKGIYCIKDVKSGFINPITVLNDGVAIRQYKMLLTNKDTEIGIFPTDYELWKIGEFNTTTGEITPTLEFIANSSVMGNIKEQEE